MKARDASHALFAGGGDDTNMPSTTIPASEVPENGLGVIDLLKKCCLVAGSGEARRLIEQGGVQLNGEKVADISRTVTKEELQAGVMIRKGKKVYHKALIG